MTPQEVIALGTVWGAYGMYLEYKENLELDGIQPPGFWDWYSDQLADKGDELIDSARDNWEDMLEGGVDVAHIASALHDIALGLASGIVIVGEKIEDIIKDMMGVRNAEAAVNDYNAAKNYRQPADPLVLDLDGDGIETIAVSAANAVMYDYNGNGIKTNTGWVSPDDGFLVFDRDNNGTIDDASELFSDYTPLYAGGQAADGFAALLQEDTNKDGVVNNLDANWNNLKIWQDINSDGVSQGEELFTMEEAGITGLNVAKSNINQTFPNGNSIRGTGTYIKDDGTTGVMGDVYFAVDTSNQQFTDTIPILPEVAALPNVQGTGLVRDLQQAAMH